MDWSIFLSVLAALAVWSAPQCLYEIYLGYKGARPRTTAMTAADFEAIGRSVARFSRMRSLA